VCVFVCKLKLDFSFELNPFI